jgi:hypothetical protein
MKRFVGLALATLALAAGGTATAQAIPGNPVETVPMTAAPPPLATGGASVGVSLDLAFILDVAGAWYSDTPMEVGGHDPAKTGFNFQALEMSVQSNVDPYFRFVANLALALDGLEIEEAFGQTTSLPWGFQIRAGQMLTRMGRMNTMHPHAWSFVDQSLMIGKFLGADGSRGLGFELSWLAPLPWFVEFVASATDAAGDATARSFLGGGEWNVHGFQDFLYTVGLKQFFPFGREWSLAWGLSGQVGPNATGHGNLTSIYATDLYLRYKPLGSPGRTSLSLTVEGMYRMRQVPQDSLRDWGGYASLVWQFARRWELGGRYEYVSGLPDDPLDPQWTTGRHRGALEASFYPSHFSRLRLQGSCDVPRWQAAPIWGAVLNLELAVGAHGAHVF